MTYLDQLKQRRSNASTEIERLTGWIGYFCNNFPPDYVPTLEQQYFVDHLSVYEATLQHKEVTQ